MAHKIHTECNGCSACSRQCPTGAIDGVFKEQYEITPFLCIDCGVCGTICPVEAVTDQWGQLVSRVSRVLRARPVVDLELCNGCGLCTDICPFDCLDVQGPRHYGVAVFNHPESCVSCGECASICIKGAMRMTALDLRVHDPAEQRRLAQEFLGLLRH